MRQKCPGCVLWLGFTAADSCRIQGLVYFLRHISPHDACVARAVLCLGGGVNIWGEPFISIYSWIYSKFYWRAGHYNPMQGLFLKTSPLPSGLWSRSYVPGSWGDVGRAASRHIRCWNHLLLRKIGWGAIYGSRDQVLWLPCSIPPSKDVCSAGHCRVCLTAVSHSNLV